MLGREEWAMDACPDPHEMREASTTSLVAVVPASPPPK
jgi:hypothetical protein